MYTPGSIRRSVVTRLAALLLLGGVMLSALVGVAELRRAEHRAQRSLTREIHLATREMQGLLSEMLRQDPGAPVQRTLALMFQNQSVQGVRLRGGPAEVVATGRWDADGDDAPGLALMGDGWTDGEQLLPLNATTRVEAPFRVEGRSYTLDVLVEGAIARHQAWDQVLESQVLQWLMLAILTLMALVVLRRVVAEPLARVSEAAARGDLAGLKEAMNRKAGDEVTAVAYTLEAVLSRSAEARPAPAPDPAEETVSRLRKQLNRHTRMLHQMLEHVSDGILVVNEDRRVAACNQRLAGLLQRRPEELLGESLNHASFWRALSPNDYETIGQRLAALEQQPASPPLRLELDRGTLLISHVPVGLPGADNGVCLWVVHDVTVREQSERLVRQQDQRLRVMHQVGAMLTGVRSVEVLLERSVALLHRLFDVEAVGVVVRGDPGSKRAQQLLYRGNVPHVLETNRKLAQALAEQLMPEVLYTSECLHWGELDRRGGWSSECVGAGLSSLAAVALPGPTAGLGFLWIAQRGGRPLDRHHLLMLQTLAPMIAGRLEVTQLVERLRRVGVADPATDVLSSAGLTPAVQAAMDAHATCSLLVLVPDQLEAIRRRLGRAAADQWLLAVAGRLAGATRLSSVLYRHGSDGFAMLVPGLYAESAESLAARLHTKARQWRFAVAGETGVQLTLSVGVATVRPEDAADADVLIARAVERAQVAGRQGGDCVRTEPVATPVG